MATKFLVVKADSSQLPDILAGTAPIFQTVRGTGAKLEATVGDGVVAVDVLKGGSGYLVPPAIRLATTGKGYNAVATAVVENGEIKEVLVDMSQARDYEDGDSITAIVEDTAVSVPQYLVAGTPDASSLRFCGGDVFAILVPDAELADEPKSDDSSDSSEA